MRLEEAKKGMLVRIQNPPKRYPGDPGMNTQMRNYFGKVVRINYVYPNGRLSLTGAGSYTWDVRWVDKVESCKLKKKRKKELQSITTPLWNTR